VVNLLIKRVKSNVVKEPAKRLGRQLRETRKREFNLKTGASEVLACCDAKHV